MITQQNEPKLHSDHLAPASHDRSITPSFSKEEAHSLENELIHSKMSTGGVRAGLCLIEAAPSVTESL